MDDCFHPQAKLLTGNFAMTALCAEDLEAAGVESQMGALTNWLTTRDSGAAFAALVDRRPLGAVDDEHFHRAGCRLSLQSELLLQRGK